MKNKRTLAIAASTFTLALAAFPHPASASVEIFLQLSNDTVHVSDVVSILVSLLT